MPIVYLACKDRLFRFLFGVKADRFPLEMMQALVECAGLCDTGIRRKVTAQHGHAAGVAKRIVQRVVNQPCGRI